MRLRGKGWTSTQAQFVRISQVHFKTGTGLAGTGTFRTASSRDAAPILPHDLWRRIF